MEVNGECIGQKRQNKNQIAIQKRETAQLVFAVLSPLLYCVSVLLVLPVRCICYACSPYREQLPRLFGPLCCLSAPSLSSACSVRLSVSSLHSVKQLATVILLTKLAISSLFFLAWGGGGCHQRRVGGSGTLPSPLKGLSREVQPGGHALKQTRNKHCIVPRPLPPSLPLRSHVRLPTLKRVVLRVAHPDLHHMPRGGSASEGRARPAYGRAPDSAPRAAPCR